LLLAGCGAPTIPLQASVEPSLSVADRLAVINLKDRVIAGKPNPVTQIKVMHVVEMNLPTGRKGKRFALSYLLWGKENGQPIGFDRSVTMDCEVVSNPDARRTFKTGHRPVALYMDGKDILKDDLAVMLLARELATAIGYAAFDQEKDVLYFVAQCLYDEVKDSF
jgi:hypothetical protein